MKKHKSIKLQPLFKKEKEYLKIINNPKKMAELKDLADNINLSTNKITQPTNLNDWLIYVTSILPKFEKETEFLEKLGELVNEYSDEREGNNSIKSC